MNSSLFYTFFITLTLSLFLTPESKFTNKKITVHSSLPEETKGNALKDSLALVSFYNSTGGPEWLKRTN